MELNFDPGTEYSDDKRILEDATVIETPPNEKTLEQEAAELYEEKRRPRSPFRAYG